jgi:hypothetical protein
MRMEGTYRNSRAKPLAPELSPDGAGLRVTQGEVGYAPGTAYPGNPGKR